MRACHFLSASGQARAVPHFSCLMTLFPPTCVGRFLVSPLAKLLDNGRFGASVSIRSGSGSASTDRVMRFIGQFDSADAAQRYAHHQGLIWVTESAQPSRALAG